MQIPGRPGCHLFYCLNAYPAASLAELERAVFQEAAGVWSATGVQGPQAVGLWLNSVLLPSFDAPAFARRLADANLYCPSLNGFPYGLFHNEPVKQQVYRPDWSQPARLDYTRALARALCAFLPPRGAGSISTLPVAYRAQATPQLLSGALTNLRAMAEELARLYDETGREIVLAIEPEPDCFLDDSLQAAQWLDEQLFAPVDGTAAGERLRRHVGVCLDTVHALVLFEEPLAALRAFTSRGIRVPKIQIGAALGSAGPDRTPLHPFQDRIYLHQTRVRAGDGAATAFPDLPPALAAAPGGEWRVHFHVPLCWPGGDGLQCIRSGIDRTFFDEACASGTTHFEVEIYTLSVFPGERIDSRALFARELQTVLDLLRPATRGSTPSRCRT